MSLPYNPHSTPDHDALLVRHAGCGLVLADMGSGEVLRLNQSWSQWLEQDALQVGTCLWDERWWEQAQAVRAAVGLGRYGVAMPPTPMLARHAQGHMVLLQFSCEPVTQDGRRLSVCTLQALPSSESPSAPSSQDSALLSLVQTLSSAVEVHDPGSLGHQFRVAHLAQAMAQHLALPPAQVRHIHLAALIHDLGKLSIPSQVLGKKGLLTEQEARLIQGHVLNGVEMIAHIEFGGPVARLIEQHHERLNGSGYPHRLQGAQIETGAQIIGIADMVEAMTRERPYQSAHTLQEALEVVQSAQGVLFLPALVQACLALFQNGYRFPSI